MTFLVSLRDPSFFIRWGGGGWLVGFEEGHEKNGFKEGVKRKSSGFKRGHQKIPSNFAVTAFVIMPKAYQNAKNQRF